MIGIGENRETASREHIITMMDIDQSTRLGSEEIKLGQMSQAIGHLNKAYVLSRQLSDDVTERACAFNLGSAYIACKQAEKGLDYLQRAVPPMNKRDGASNGDLFQNIALGYEQLNKQTEMVRYFELALDEYRRENQGVNLEIAICVKLAKALVASGQIARAANVYDRLATVYDKMAEAGGRADALMMKAKLLEKCQDRASYFATLEQCLEICVLLLNTDHKCRILEDVGLAYTQCKNYDKAVACFEQELELVQQNPISSEREAITLQNLGAVESSRGAYEKAVSYQSSAARVFGELGKRKNQGHCFVNMAYAYARFGDTESAAEAYSHALLAARDSKDKIAEWQAAEGLAAVHFLRGQTEKAIQHYKQALCALSGLESETKAQERIVAKLTDALHYKVVLSAATSARSSMGGTPPAVPTSPQSARLGPTMQPVSGKTWDLLTVREQTISPTIVGRNTGQLQSEKARERTTPALSRVRVSATDPRYDETRQAGTSASTDDLSPEPTNRERRQSDVSLKINDLHRTLSEVSTEIRRPSVPLKRRGSAEPQLYKLSLGLGEYESDSDRSLSSSSGSDRRPNSVDRLSDEMDGMLKQYRDQQSDYRKNRPDTARSDRRDVQTTAESTSLQTTAESTSLQTTAESTSRQTAAESTSRQTAAESTSLHTTAESTSRQTTEAETEERNTNEGRHVNGARAVAPTHEQTSINVADSWESDLEWKGQAAQFFNTKSTDTSGTTDSSTDPTRAMKPATKHVSYGDTPLEGQSESDYTTYSETETDSEESLPSQNEPRRAIQTNLDRRPIGGRTSGQPDADKSRLQQAESLPTAPPLPVGTKALKKSRRFSEDSEGIVTTPSSQDRRLNAIRKLRDSFVDENGSEQDDSANTKIDVESSARAKSAPADMAAPVDPLLTGSYERVANFFQDDELNPYESLTSDTSDESLDAEEEALYATIGQPEPSTSQGVFKASTSANRTPRNELEYTGPMEPPPSPPVGVSSLSRAEREQFQSEYQRRKDEILRRDEERAAAGGGGGGGSGGRPKRSSLCVTM